MSLQWNDIEPQFSESSGETCIALEIVKLPQSYTMDGRIEEIENVEFIYCEPETEPGSELGEYLAPSTGIQQPVLDPGIICISSGSSSTGNRNTPFDDDLDIDWVGIKLEPLDPPNTPDPFELDVVDAQTQSTQPQSKEIVFETNEMDHPVTYTDEYSELYLEDDEIEESERRNRCTLYPSNNTYNNNHNITDIEGRLMDMFCDENDQSEPEQPEQPKQPSETESECFSFDYGFSDSSTSSEFLPPNHVSRTQLIHDLEYEDIEVLDDTTANAVGDIQ